VEFTTERLTFSGDAASTTFGNTLRTFGNTLWTLWQAWALIWVIAGGDDQLIFAPTFLEKFVNNAMTTVNGTTIENLSPSKQIVKFVDMVRTGNVNPEGETTFVTFYSKVLD
jgi:hypothetical protein